MATLEQIAASLLSEGEHKAIAAENPYLSLSSVASEAGPFASKLYMQNPTRSNGRDALIANAVGGLLGGLFQGMGGNYQDTLTDRYVQSKVNMASGGTGQVENLPDSLFKTAQQANTLFNLKQAQAQQERKHTIEDTALTKLYGILGEQGAYELLSQLQGGGSTGSTNLMNPVVEKKLDLEDKYYDRITKLPAYKTISEISDNFETIKSLANQDSRAASIGLISAIARIWDPGGTVREGEYALNAQAQSALDAAYGNWREFLQGKGVLQPDAKKALIEAAGAKYNAFRESYDIQKNKQLQSLQDLGGNPANIPMPEYSPFGGVRILRNKKTGEIKFETI